MKRLYIEESWPQTWKYSYPYDLQEVWGEVVHEGYSYSYANRKEKTLKLLSEVLGKGASVLDVAAAQGNFSIALAEKGYIVTWNDMREELVGYVKEKYEYGVLNFAPGNVFDLCFSELFDCVLITEIIEHVAHPDEFLKKISTLVKPGGYIVMSTPNGAYFRNNLPRFSDCDDPSIFESDQFKPNSDGHIFLLWEDEVSRLADRAGLVLDKHVIYTNPLTAGHVKLGKLLKIMPKSMVNYLEWLSQKVPYGIRNKLMTSSSSRFIKN